MNPIISDLLDMFPDTVSYNLPTIDGYGKETSGSASTIRAFISGSTKQVRLGSGQIAISTMQVTVAGAPGLTVNHQITLPSRFSLKTPKIIAVKQNSDENGPHHEIVYFS
jgi:hypothetical protein